MLLRWFITNTTVALAGTAASPLDNIVGPNGETGVGWILDRTQSDLYPRFIQNGGPDFTNPANYRPTTYNNSILQNDDVIREARMNARYTFPTAFPFSLKSGGVWRRHYADAQSVARRWNYAGTAALPADPSIVTFDSVKTGRRIPQWEALQFFAERQPINPALWTEDRYFNEQNKYTANRAVTETVTAGYALAQGRVGRELGGAASRDALNEIHPVNATIRRLENSAE